MSAAAGRAGCCEWCATNASSSGRAATASPASKRVLASAKSASPPGSLVAPPVNSGPFSAVVAGFPGSGTTGAGSGSPEPNVPGRLGATCPEAAQAVKERTR